MDMWEEEADGVEYAPSESDNDISYQYSEKIRNQALRLKDLEIYKQLCEKRILELCPDHEIPISQNHLGAVIASDSVQLQAAQNKIRMLESQIQKRGQPVQVQLAEGYTFPSPQTALSFAQLQELYAAMYYKYQECLKDKTQMEESLKSEVLISEEQRSYIEVLKQSISVKIGEKGIKEENIDLYVEYGNLQSENDEMRKDHANLQRSFQNLCNELDAMRNKQPTPSEEDLSEAAQALQIAQNEIAKLEEEKLTLIEYVATSKDNEDRFQSQLESQNKQIEMLSNQVNKYKDQKEDLEKDFEQQKGELEEQLELHREELVEQLELAENEAHRETEEAEAANEELQGQYEELSKQHEALKVKNQSLKENNTTLSNLLQETQEELDSAKEPLKKLEQETQNLKQQNAVMNQQIASFESKKSQLKDKLSEVKSNKSTELTEQQQRIAMLKQTLGDTQEVKETLQKELSSQKEQIIELKEKLDLATEQQAVLKDKFRASKQKSEEMASQLLNTTRDKDQVTMEANKIQSELNGVKNRKTQYERELEQLKNKNELMQKDYYELSETCRSNEDKLYNIISENDALRQKADTLESELESEVSRRNFDTAHAAEQNDFKVRAFESYITNLCAYIKSASYRLRNISSDSPSMISDGFVGVLSRWMEMPSDPLPLIEQWVQAVADEVETLSGRSVELKVEAKNSSQIIEKLTSGEIEHREREKILRAQLESIQGSVKNSPKKEHVFMQSQNNENLPLKIGSPSKGQTQLVPVQDLTQIRTFEEKIDLLLTEKESLEKLNRKICEILPNTELKAVVGDMLRTENELEELERNQIRIRGMLMQSETEMRLQARQSGMNNDGKSIALRREVENLRAFLDNNEQQIEVNRKKLGTLEDELPIFQNFTCECDIQKQFPQMLAKEAAELDSPLSIKEGRILDELDTPERRPLRDSATEDRPVPSGYYENLKKIKSSIDGITRKSDI